MTSWWHRIGNLPKVAFIFLMLVLLPGVTDRAFAQGGRLTPQQEAWLRTVYMSRTGTWDQAAINASAAKTWIQANSNMVWVMTNNWPWVTSTISWTSNGYVNLSNSWFGSTAYRITDVATQAWWQATVNSSSFTNWLTTNTYVQIELDTVFTNWLSTNPPMSDVAWTNWLATNTFATTNWVDTEYYPRNNPSNYVTASVTNGLVGTEVDPLALHTNGDNQMMADLNISNPDSEAPRGPGAGGSIHWNNQGTYIEGNSDISHTDGYFIDIGFGGTPHVSYYDGFIDYRGTVLSNGVIDSSMSGCPSGAIPTNLPVMIDPGNTSTNTFGGSTVTLGDKVQEGSGVAASGAQSHAEGKDTIASGDISHAEGELTEASGDGSHAEGSISVASGDGSHAEGRESIASGYYSHAEGFRAEASNSFSFAWQGSLPAGEPYYGSHGNGSFNINPIGGLSGFWLGETNFSTLFSQRVATNDPAYLAAFTNIVGGTFTGRTIYVSSGAADGGATGLVYDVATWYDGTNRIQHARTNDFGGGTSSGGGAWGGGVVTTNITVSNSLPEIKGQDASNRWWRLAESNGTVTLYRKALDIVTVPTGSNIVWTDSALGQQDHWNFESNATPQIDLWQGSNSMAHSGSPVWTITGTNQDGVVEHGYRFDGTTYMHNETLTGLSNTSGSVSMWMKFDSLPLNDQAVAWSFWYTNGTYLAGNQTFVDFSGLWNNVGVTYWRADGRKAGTTQWTVINAFTETTNVWYNVTLVQPGDGSDMQFYINGIKRPLTYNDSTSKSFWTAQARGTALRADSLWLMRYNFKGVLDDPRIYTNALTSNQVYQIWQNTSPTNNLERTYQATASYNVTNTSEKAIFVATASGTTNENGVQTFGEATGRTVIEGASTRLNVSGSEVLKLDSTGLNPGTDNLTPLGKTGAKYSDVQTYKLNGVACPPVRWSGVRTNGIGTAVTNRDFYFDGVLTNSLSP